MNNQEISVEKLYLVQKVNNLYDLSHQANALKVLSSNNIMGSCGYSAGTMRDCHDATQNIKIALSDLMQNSVDFFTKACVAFEEVDTL